jgi:hypothetical protein
VPTTPSASAQGAPAAAPVQLASGAFCAEAAPAAARRLRAGGGRVVRSRAARLGREQLGDSAAERRVGRARVERRRGGAHREPRALERRVALGEPKRARLKVGDAAAKLRARVCVLGGVVERDLPPSQRQRTDADAPAVERGHGDGKAAALGAEARGRGRAHAVEKRRRRRQRAPAHLALRAAEAQPRGAFLEEEGGDPGRARAAGARKDEGTRRRRRRR